MDQGVSGQVHETAQERGPTKRTETIIGPHRLDAVKTALKEVGSVAKTITRVEGLGRQKGGTRPTVAASSEGIPTVCEKGLTERAVEATIRTAHTQRLGALGIEGTLSGDALPNALIRRAPSAVS